MVRCSYGLISKKIACRDLPITPTSQWKRTSLRDVYIHQSPTPRIRKGKVKELTRKFSSPGLEPELLRDLISSLAFTSQATVHRQPSSTSPLPLSTHLMTFSTNNLLSFSATLAVGNPTGFRASVSQVFDLTCLVTSFLSGSVIVSTSER
jgi:hypothetical protein